MQVDGMNLESRMGDVAIVTGGGGGIGEATCRKLAKRGMLVVVADIREEAALAVARDIRDLGGRAAGYHLDVAEHGYFDAFIRQVLLEHGGIDVLVNNAADAQSTAHDKAVGDIDPAVWARQLDVNLSAPLLLCKAVIPAMLARGSGAIVHVSSAAGLRAEHTRSGYGITKAALLGLSRSIAVQYGKQGIRSNVVAPGLVLTEAAHKAFPADALALLSEHHMSPRLGVPEDIAAAIAFLTSEDAAFINGALLSVDGGFTAYAGAVPALRRLGI